MKFIYSNWKSIVLSAVLAFGMGGFSHPAQARSYSHSMTSSSAIRTAQQHLKDAGYYTGPIDGMSGPMTRTAIRKFQGDNNLTVNGRLDPATRDKLMAKGEASRTETGGMTTTASSSTISAAQRALQDKGFYKGDIDGQMSSETQSAIREYQKNSNLNTLNSLGVSK
jgi:peptidoglycan hydrolase-like protein with peptidoglycan-binding domain